MREVEVPESDPFGDWIAAMFKHYGKRLTDAERGLWERTLANVPQSFLSDMLVMHLSRADVGERLPRMDQFVKAWSMHQEDMLRRQKRREGITAKTPEQEAQSDVRRLVAVHLSGVVIRRIEDEPVDERIRRVVSYALQRFAANFPNGLPDQPIERQRIVESYCNKAVKLLTEDQQCTTTN